MQNLIPRIGVGVVVIKEDRVLLGKRKGSHGADTWSFAGGHLEYGESVEDCTRRELEEETGLKALSIRHGPWTNDVIETGKHYVTLFVFVHDFEGEVQLLEPHKCYGWEWFAWNQLPSPLFTPIYSFLKKIQVEKLNQMFSLT